MIMGDKEEEDSSVSQAVEESEKLEKTGTEAEVEPADPALAPDSSLALDKDGPQPVTKDKTKSKYHP